MFKKNTFTVILSLCLVLMLAACGKNSNSVNSSAKYDDYHGEGEIQGGIKSDEDIARIDEEIKQYEAEKNKEAEQNEDTWDGAEDDTESEINVEMETPTAFSTYIGAENFWQGDDYFDLENFLYMNGATKVLKGGFDSDYDFEERDHDITMYKAYFSNPYWIVTIQTVGSGSIEYRYDGYLLNGEPVLSPVHTTTTLIPIEKQTAIRVNDQGTTLSDATIQILDKTTSLMKEHPDDDDPFQYNDETTLFIYDTSTNVPAGVTKR